nr:Gp37 family protein [Pasteurella multocida]
MARSQHNDDGALAILDQVRLAIVGFRPENCLACALKAH